MLHDIAPHELNNQAGFGLPCDDDFALVYHRRTAEVPYYSVLVRKSPDGTYSLPTYGELDCDFPFVYALSLDGGKAFLARPEKSLGVEQMPHPEGCQYIKMSMVRSLVPAHLALLILTGFHLHIWYRDNVYCGRCGKKLAYSHEERALECRSCGNVVYPRISPAIVVAVTDGDKILLTRSSVGTKRHRALVSGFIEIGESAEQTVEREVMEEVGLRVKNIRYFASQPWGLAGNLMLGYFAELDGDPKVTLQESELSEAQWVAREDIVEEESYALTFEMIQRFKADDLPF